MRENCLVHVSGDLVFRGDFHEWVRELTRSFFVVVEPGAGTQSNQAMGGAGFEVKEHGPCGRNTDTNDERLLSLVTQKGIQATLQDTFMAKGICVAVDPSWLVKASVDCPITGEISIIAHYHGFKELWVATIEDRVAEKEAMFTAVMVALNKGKSVLAKHRDKIRVKGFPVVAPT